MIENLSAIDVLAKLGPTGLMLILSWYVLREIGGALSRRSEHRQKAVDANSDKLFDHSSDLTTNALAFVHSIQALLGDCERHRAECADELADARRARVEQDSRIATLEAQQQSVSGARQMAQQMIAANRAAEKGD